MKFLLTIFWALSAMLVFAEKQPFERYQSILDRMPFGDPPPGFAWDQNPNDVQKGSDTAKELTVEQENLQKSVSFSVMDVMEDGTVRVGFSDLSDAKTPRHYFMTVGEERDGWLVREADPAKREMTVVKDQVEVTLTLGASSTGGAPNASGNSSSAAPAASTASSPRAGLLNRNALGVRGRGLLGSGSAGGLQSKRSRREQRLQAEAWQAAADAAREEEKRAKAADDAARKAEEDAAREAERAEQRQQLMAIQEELRKAREEKQRQMEEARESEGIDASNES